jgi:hypothetical protein
MSLRHQPTMIVPVSLDPEVVDFLIIRGWLDEQDSQDPVEVSKAVHDFLEMQVFERGRLYNDH